MPDAARQRYNDACARVEWAMRELNEAIADRIRAQQALTGNIPARPAQTPETQALPRMRNISECIKMYEEMDPQSHITRETIKRLINAGRLQVVRIGSRRVLINFDALCECLRNPTPEEPTPAARNMHYAARGIRPQPE